MKNTFLSLFCKSGLFILLTYYFFSCQKEEATIVEGYVYDSTDAQQIKPLPSARIDVGAFNGGGGIISGKNYHTTYSDANGYYQLKFKDQGAATYSISCKKDSMIYTSLENAVNTKQSNKIDFYLYR